MLIKDDHDCDFQKKEKNEEKMWTSVWKPKVPTRWNELFFMILHQALWTGEKAERLGFHKISPDCSECGVQETLTHLFFTCVRARDLRGNTWNSMASVLEESSEEQRAHLWTIWADRNRCIFDGVGYDRTRAKAVQAEFSKKK